MQVERSGNVGQGAGSSNMTRRLLPSSQSLQAFEAAARHLNFTRAAEELNLTQGAVSQQIRVLERIVGTDLFRRASRGLALTPTGQRLYKSARDVIGQLRAIVAPAPRHKKGDVLTIRASPWLLDRWLVPRLGEFRSAQPEVRICVEGVATPEAGDRNDAVSIRVTRSISEPEFDFQLLSHDTIFPVCSPTIKDRANRALIEERGLLYVPQAQESCSVDVRSWLAQFGGQCARDICFDSCTAALSAAVAGCGVALTRGLAVDSDLKRGTLIKLDEFEMPCEESYYLMYPHELADKPDVTALRTWLIAQFRLQEALRASFPRPSTLKSRGRDNRFPMTTREPTMQSHRHVARIHGP